MKLLTYKDKMIDFIIRECLLFSEKPFKLKSGGVSNHYIDLKKAVNNPLFRKWVKKLFEEITEDEIPSYPANILFAGIEIGSIPIAVSFSDFYCENSIIIRKKQKEHGTGKLIEGSFDVGSPVILFEDVTTTYSTIKHAIEVLRNAGLVVHYVVSIVDRTGKDKAEFERENLVSYLPLIRFEEILAEVIKR